MKHTKKIKKAAAIHYDTDDQAPMLIAKGAGEVADRILEKGKASDIPVYRDENLVESLTRLELGEEIPPELYEVVAEIMVFVSDLDRLYDKYK